ncbi:penicillin-binding protein 2 [Candidatus Sulfidibacterium hydrothermale]|uniref:penicillin-binding protein 2 n=1 Tax=Candidatus Sulfidibacterium hydrothermale TaxID=2875962 RepID=UPI001F0A6301|nr:penicillin-binding protein 2 [Candidatus Sulfidibacterium hydrothermale]UBM62563.1 penicillin-binding protein 2 [Candidatus Sulfidibacterium hydrothermale]
MYRKDYSARKYVIIAAFVLVAVIFAVRLFYLQVYTNQYKLSARDIALRRVVEYPARGRIYDRHHRLLVYNDAVYDLMVIPRQVKKMDTAKFCRLLQISKDFFIRQMKKAKHYSYYKPSIFLKQLSKKEKGPIEEVMYEFPGFYFQTRTLRHYPHPVAAHVLGSVGEVSPADIRRDPYYRQGDYIGKSGIEWFYEKELRGKKGSRLVEVDVHNNVKGSFQNGRYDTLAVPGADLTLSLDEDLQAYGQRLMKNKKGSIVALVPQTGEILAFISSPEYDPNLLVGRERSANYLKLLHDSLKPLLNRASSGTYPPGSTFKLVQALIGLQEHVVTPNTLFTCQGTASKPIACSHNHVSPLRMKLAIELSCNSYFWKTFRAIIDDPHFSNTHDAYDAWYKKVISFGFGHKFNTDIPFEKPGNIPTRAYYNKVYHGSWNALTIRSLSIGQGEILVTPVQLANLAAIIANSGYYVKPHFLIGMSGDDTLSGKYKKKYRVAINPKYFKVARQAMEEVFSGPEGTARFYQMDSITQAGKTGTVQNPHGKDHSIFMAFAPYKHPKIAIAVVVENAGFGSTWAAPIASLMMEHYLRGKTKRPRLEKRILDGDLIHNQKVKKP